MNKREIYLLNKINSKKRVQKYKFDLGVYYLHTSKDYEKALAIFNELYKIEPLAPYWNHLGMLSFKMILCYEFLDKIPEAIEESTRFIDLLEDNLVYEKVMLFKKSYKFRSKKDFKRELGVFYKQRGHLYRKLSDLNNMIDDYVRAAELDKQNYYWFKVIAEELIKSGNDDEAKFFLKEYEENKYSTYQLYP